MMRAALLITVPLLMGCMKESAGTAEPVDGKALFAENCAVCHGADAKGRGPVSGGLSTPPADLTRIADRRGGVWPMLEVMSIIDGYTKATEPREDMPVIADLSEGPTVVFDTGNGVVRREPARLVALATYLESIQMPRPVTYVP